MEGLNRITWQIHESGKHNLRIMLLFTGYAQESILIQKGFRVGQELDIKLQRFVIALFFIPFLLLPHVRYNTIVRRKSELSILN